MKTWTKISSDNPPPAGTVLLVWSEVFGCAIAAANVGAAFYDPDGRKLDPKSLTHWRDMVDEPPDSEVQEAVEHKGLPPTPDAFGIYMLQVARREAAMAEYNRASIALTNARIMERLAQAESQFEPLNSLMHGETLTLRQALVAAAHWVVVGCFPEWYINMGIGNKS